MTSSFSGSRAVRPKAELMVLCSIALLSAACGGGSQPGTVSPDRHKAEQAARKAVAEEQSLGTKNVEPRSIGHSAVRGETAGYRIDCTRIRAGRSADH